jgi:hypothetical protein
VSEIVLGYHDSECAKAPGFMACMAQQGYKVRSPGEIHSAPPEVLPISFMAR